MSANSGPIFGNVFRIKEPRHTGESRKTAGPFEQRPRVAGVDDRVGESHMPVHAGAERLVLRAAAAAETVMFQRRAGVARDGRVVIADERYAARDAVRTVARHADVRGARDVDLLARLPPVDGKAERP